MRLRVEGRDKVSGNKTIALVGVSEQEGAHLRLLLRKSAQELDHTWRWGDENDADLVVVDVRSFAGQMARTRAQGAGVRYAVFTDAKKTEDADLILQRPLQRANVIAVFNQAAGAVARNPNIGAQTADFYTRDLGEDMSDVILPDLETRFHQPSPVAGLDELLSPEPMELRGDGAWTPPSAPIPAADRIEMAAESTQHAPMPAVPLRTYATRELMLADTAPRDLRAYLDVNLLQVPARFTLTGMPTLTLDPKNKVAHAAVGLGGLAPYCRSRWRLCDWQPLTNSELADVRETQQPQGYQRLTWLYVLLSSGGHLASHLDPGGTYRLKHWVEIEKELSRYFRIASAMLQPARLHEIAATAAAPMADVFDLVNAYDAIGMIEWQPRPRRDDGAEKKPPSLFGRLRKPFGKS
ncbi:MAG: hypothetical protein ABIQ70_13855 [Dokdonella sp.]